MSIASLRTNQKMRIGLARVGCGAPFIKLIVRTDDEFTRTSPSI